MKDYTIATAAMLVLLSLYGVFIASGTDSILDDKIAEAKEIARPADVQFTTIGYTCEGCFEIEPVLEQLKSTNIYVQEQHDLAYDDPKAQELIAAYGIQRLPALIVTGEINKSPDFVGAFASIGENRDEAMVTTKQMPPYYDMQQERVVGKVKATIIQDSSCENCHPVDDYLTSLEQAGLVISKETLEMQHAEELLDRYDIHTVPALILDDEASYYPGFDQIWSQLGSVEENNYVLRVTMPPYINVTTGETEGIVDMILLDDALCEDCYDPAVHKNILARYGVVLDSVVTYDISSPEGQEMIDKYDITKVPTMILTKDALAYSSFANIWKQVGSVDDMMIFRNIDAMGKVVYKDLSTEQLVNGPAQNTVTSGDIREISMVARNWEFDPSVIEVEQGENIRLRIKSEDVSHGIAVPELGIDKKFGPGEEVTVEFTATEVGEFPFYCNVYCGQGHGDMTGKIVVT